MLTLRLTTFIAALLTAAALLLPAAATADNIPERITVAEVKALLDRGEEVTFIDTRRDPDLAASAGKIPEAIRVRTNEELAAAVKTLPRDGKIVTYCS